MTILQLENVTKTYPGGETALREADLAMEAGEFLVLLGPQGSGKSTLLRLVGGLDDVTEGILRIDGKTANDLTPKERDIAMIGQNQSLPAQFTVYDNLAYGLRLRKVPEDIVDREVRAAAAVFGLGELLGRRTKTLPVETRQRVLLARSLVRRPKLFLFDDPFNHLDEALHARMCAELAKLHVRLDASFVYATEDRAEALALGTRVAVMNAGRIEQVGTPLELYDAPASLFVADYLGALNKLRTVRVEGNTVHADGFTAVLPQAAERDGEAVFAVRPEDIRPEASFAEAHPETSFRACVTGEEPIGPDRLLHCETLGETPWSFDVRTASEGEFPGERTFAFDGTRILLFDAKTGESLLKRA